MPPRVTEVLVSVLEVVLDRAASIATVTRLDIADRVSNPNETGWAYDPAHQIIGGGVVDGKFLALDPAARTWAVHTMNVESADGAVPNLAFRAIDHDPVDGVFLWLSAGDVRTWAYRFESCSRRVSARQRVSARACPSVRACLGAGAAVRRREPSRPGQ